MDRIGDPLSMGSEVQFGAVDLSDAEIEFCTELDDEVIALCRSLPESTQADALLLFRRYFRVPFNQQLPIFMKNYYSPSWSIIYWLIEYDRKSKYLTKNNIADAKCAHAMALLLHPIDDHLNDKQLEATHLSVLIRSQLWLKLNRSLGSLAAEVDGGDEIIKGFFDDYYSSIMNSTEIVTLNDYCDIFRKQMSIGYIAPALIMKILKVNDDFYTSFQIAYGSFGIAWRLLDDIHDIKMDLMNGSKSSVYICLPEKLKNYWVNYKAMKLRYKNGYLNIILKHIASNQIINNLIDKSFNELILAKSITEKCKLPGLAAEFRSLSDPLNAR